MIKVMKPISSENDDHKGNENLSHLKMTMMKVMKLKNDKVQVTRAIFY